MKRIGSIVGALALGLLVLAGCEEKEGPAERMGKQLDQSMGEASEKMKEGMERAGEKMQELGERMQDHGHDH